MRLILTDLDHTLLREDGSISETSLRILEKCRAGGMLLAIATARYWIGAERYIRQLRPDYEITTEGTLVHAREECIYSCAFSEADTNRIIHSILAVSPGADISVAHGKTVYWNNPHIADSEKLRRSVYCDYTAPLRVCANKIVAGLPEERMAESIAGETGSQLQRYRGENWYAFLPRGAGKTAAIRALCRTSGIRPDDIVAFGDDTNDIDMLKLCGTGVAVANALPEVLRAADDITLSNDLDGVALWLNCRCLYRSLLASTYNTRDLGGRPVPSGGQTARNRIWRSDAPTAPNQKDAETLTAHRITTVIDLRTEQETAKHPCAFAQAEGFTYRPVPITIGSVPPDTPEEVPLSYLQIAMQKETAEVLRIIAGAENGVLFCCTAGKDRTGVISALLLLACGVDHQTIADDYAVSREYNRIRLERYLAEHPEVDRRTVLASEESMLRFIRLFLSRFGSVEAYFAQAGLTAEQLTRIRAKLLGPDGA